VNTQINLLSELGFSCHTNSMLIQKSKLLTVSLDSKIKSYWMLGKQDDWIALKSWLELSYNKHSYSNIELKLYQNHYFAIEVLSKYDFILYDSYEWKNFVKANAYKSNACW